MARATEVRHLRYTKRMSEELSALEACKRGDPTSFGVLYDQYAAPIYRFIYYKTFSKEVAEDLVSDTFHKALTRIQSYDADKGSFSSWLYRIARNTVIDYYRTRHATVPVEDLFELGADERIPEAHDAVRALERVYDYLNTLSPRQREIITLRVWEGKSYREIADIMESTESAVKMAFSRSIRDLREKCGPIAIMILATWSTPHALPFHTLS